MKINHVPEILMFMFMFYFFSYTFSIDFVTETIIQKFNFEQTNQSFDKL